jgi:hypothetical protein
MRYLSVDTWVIIIAVAVIGLLRFSNITVAW